MLAATLVEGGLEIVSGGTDSHLMLVDLRPLGLTGRDAEASLGRAGITCNKNGIPFDPQKPTVTSGIRLGSPAATTRGFGPEEFRTGRELHRRGPARARARTSATMAQPKQRVREKVRELCARFPILRRAEPSRETLAELEQGGEMRCPFCGADDTQVKDSRPTDDRGAIRRRRFCPNCAARFTTFERVQLRELTVIKKHGQREPFDRDKLARSIYIALRKRPVEPERLRNAI